MAFRGFVGLGTVDEAGDFQELDAPGYGRQPFEFRDAINGRLEGAGNWVTWSAVFNDPDGYNSYAFFEEQEGGAPMLVYPESTIHFMGSGEHASMNPYSVVIKLIDSTTGSGVALDRDKVNALVDWEKQVQPGDGVASEEEQPTVDENSAPAPRRRRARSNDAGGQTDDTSSPPLEVAPAPAGEEVKHDDFHFAVPKE